MSEPYKSSAYRTALRSWFEQLIGKAREHTQPWSPCIQSLQEALQTSSVLHMLCTQALAAGQNEYAFDPGWPKIKDCSHLLALMNCLLARAPEFDKSGLIGVIPFFCLFSCAFGKDAQTDLLLHDEWNRHLKQILEEWTGFLSAEASCYVLNTDRHHGWLGEDAMEKMPNFTRDFACFPGEPHWGFKSWDQFFTRALRPNARPVASPDDDGVVTNCCESAPYRLWSNVQEDDTFWLKGFRYSLRHLLASKHLAKELAGGTIYQALLKAFNYHRWHSPVSGRIRSAEVVGGANYWAAIRLDSDELNLLNSQAAMAHLASRAIITIEADHPGIGLMCVVAVGMADVSSCELTVQPGQRIRKGEQLGMFHFGGSTHCLLFKPGVALQFDLHGQVPGLTSASIPVNARIAQLGGL